ncbi:Hypothetical predicted protein [Octopus vulgaris]|uniref:Uncharacterized protein n=1 Tax=Octopus vulgaris TaxID=6645 RepID=A0AA36AVW2_OCTVU|nr:Hypothetical predicted protein [Octopus vulgaris]
MSKVGYKRMRPSLRSRFGKVARLAAIRPKRRAVCIQSRVTGNTNSKKAKQDNIKNDNNEEKKKKNMMIGSLPNRISFGGNRDVY